MLESDELHLVSLLLKDVIGHCMIGQERDLL